MSELAPASTTEPSATGSPRPLAPSGRLARLALKEIRESLRDRRTIITLVLMPLLLYPLLTVAFQQFLLSRSESASPRPFRVGFTSKRQEAVATAVLAWAPRPERESSAGLPAPPVSLPGSGDTPPGQVPAPLFLSPEAVDETPESQALIEAALLKGDVDLIVRLSGQPSVRPFRGQSEIRLDPDRDQKITWDLTYYEGTPEGERAARYLDRWLRAANQEFLGARLAFLGVTQQPNAVQTNLKPIRVPGTSGSMVSLAALVPLILILMTITGAVYPAIDLTAGERERGTLELLVAAPVPRLDLLLAKYAAVLLVAMLTATVNLGTMGITLALSGIGPALFGDRGIPLVAIAQIFGLLALFAAFFSAVLLAITSFARSFKEAQAYLIPLMLLAMAPGFVSLLPGIELRGLFAVVPLLNIVLLARDLLEGGGGGPTAALVIVSTVLYALGAIAVAARTFGTDAVVNATPLAWSDLWRKPSRAPVALAPSSALLLAAVMFPLFLLGNAAVSRFGGQAPSTRLGLAVVVQVLVFLVLPWAVAARSRVPWKSIAPLRLSSAAYLVAALALGLSLWTLAHELALLLQSIGLGAFQPEALKRYQQGLDDLRAAVPPPLLVLAFAVVPAVTEELFFRSVLFGALRQRLSGRGTVLATALIFGLFHLVTPSQILVERFVISGLLGLVLGWLRLRSGSVLPGLLLHVTHNALLMLLFSFQKQLQAAGWGVAEQSHLPLPWIATGASLALLGLLIAFFSRPRQSVDPS